MYSWIKARLGEFFFPFSTLAGWFEYFLLPVISEEMCLKVTWTFYLTNLRFPSFPWCYITSIMWLVRLFMFILLKSMFLFLFFVLRTQFFLLWWWSEIFQFSFNISLSFSPFLIAGTLRYLFSPVLLYFIGLNFTFMFSISLSVCAMFWLISLGLFYSVLFFSSTVSSPLFKSFYFIHYNASVLEFFWFI